MKKLVLGLIATVMFSFAGNAQTVSKGISPLDQGNSTWLPIPTELKSEVVISEKAVELSSDLELQNQLTTISNFHPKLNGLFTMVFDSNNKIVSMTVPKSSGYTITASRRLPAGVKACEDKPTTAGVILCMYNAWWSSL